MIALDLAELAARANEVVVADVREAVAEPAHGGYIVTRVVVRVVETVAGSSGPADEIDVIVPGGVLDGVGLLVHGAPQLSPGQRYLLFLERTGSAYGVVGMAQGAFEVQRTRSGDALVVPPTNLPSLVRPREGALRPAGPAIVAPTPLRRVVDEVRRAAR